MADNVTAQGANTQEWPKKLTVEGFKADGNTTAFETLVIAHEGVSAK